jgi:hypothetical protein
MSPVSVGVSKGVRAAFSLAIIIVLALLAGLAIYLQSPPAAAPESAAPEGFSSGRALKHLQVIARQPHPLGSSEHAAVRDYLVGKLKELGLDPEVQRATAPMEGGGSPYLVGTVHNIIGRLRGAGGGRSVLLVGHYDTVPSSPGASDDGSAIALLLETARALKAGPPLKNDLLFLFTDGEEPGLLGARAFVAEHPAAKGVGLALNFDARGSGGPVHMFETSGGNGWLIREFAAAAPYPLANSLSYEIYRRLPNDTDLSVFKRAGLAGLNFAYIDNLRHYHTAADSLAHLDERSLQHGGSYALALARHFGNLDTDRPETGDAVYFNPLGTLFVHYPRRLAAPLAAFTALLFVWVFARGSRRGLLSGGGVTRGAVALLLCAVASSFAATLAWKIVRALHAGYSSAPNGDVDRWGVYTLGLVFLTVAMSAAVWAWFRRKAALYDLSVGALGVWALLALVTSAALPGASYLFTWPLLFALIAQGYLLSSKEGRAGSLVISAALAIPGVLLLSPLIKQALVALTLGSAGAVLVLEVLLLSLLLPQLDALTNENRRWLLSGASALMAFCLILTGLLTGRFDGWQPKVDNAFYALDADTGKAIWGSSDRRADEWTSQFFTPSSGRSSLPDFFPLARGFFLKADAPALALEAPQVTLLQDRREQDVRTLQLRVVSTRGGPVVSFYADAENEVIAASVNGAPLRLDAGGHSERRWALSYVGFPPEGAMLTLSVKAGPPLKLRVDDRAYGLPQIPGKVISPRPDYIIPPSFNDITLVSKLYTF